MVNDTFKEIARERRVPYIDLFDVRKRIDSEIERTDISKIFLFLLLLLLLLREREGRYARTKFFPDRKLLHYGSLPRRPRQLEGREMAHNVVEDSDYPRASPNVRITSFVCLRFEERISSQGDE